MNMIMLLMLMALMVTERITGLNGMEIYNLTSLQALTADGK